MFCHKCGKPLPADGAFCPSCGSPVAAVPSAPAEPQPPAAPAASFPAPTETPIAPPAASPAPQEQTPLSPAPVPNPPVGAAVPPVQPSIQPPAQTAAQPVPPQPYIPAPEGGEPPVAPKKSRKGLLIALISVIAVLVLAGAGVLSWYFVFRDTDSYSDSDDEDDEDDENESAGSRGDRASSDSGYVPNSSRYESPSSYPGYNSSSTGTASPDSSYGSGSSSVVRKTSDYASGASFIFRAESYLARLRSDPTFSGMPALSEWEQGVNYSNIPYYRIGDESVAMLLFITGSDHSGYVAEIKLQVSSEKDTGLSDDEIAAECVPLVSATLGISEAAAENLVNDAYSAGSADYQSVKLLFEKDSDGSRAFYMYAYD